MAARGPDEVRATCRDRILHVEEGNMFIEGKIAIEAPKELEATHVEVARPRYRRGGRGLAIPRCQPPTLVAVT